MIKSISMKLVDGKRLLKVDKKVVTGAGSSTWFTNQQRETTDPVNIVDRHIEYMKSYGMNLTRVWDWWNDPTGMIHPTSSYEYLALPVSGTDEFYERAAYVVQRYLESDIIPIYIIYRAWRGSVGRDDWEFTKKDREHADRLVKIFKGVPLIWDIINEMPEEAVDFVKEATAYLKSIDTENKPITLNTGYGSGGVSESHLISLTKSVGAHSYAMLDGDEKADPKLVALSDTDHSRKALSTDNPDVRLGFFKDCKSRGAQMYLNMEGWMESWFHPTRGSSDVDNPSFPPAREWLGDEATQIGPPEPPIEPPPIEPPPIDPPEPPIEPPPIDPPNTDTHDLVQIICPVPSFGLETADGKNTVWTVHNRSAGSVTNIKNPKGTAADSDWYDEDGYYLWITEAGDWSDATSFKHHVPGWSIAWPRFFKDADLPITNSNLDTSFQQSANCVDGPTMDVGVGQVRLKGPYKAGGVEVAGGDIAPSDVAYKMEWIWQNGERLEVYTNVVGFGRCRWQRFDRIAGEWELVNESPIRNVVTTKPAPVFETPCFDLADEIARMKDEKEEGGGPIDPPPVDPPGGGLPGCLIILATLSVGIVGCLAVIVKLITGG